MATLQQPKLLLLDEHTAALDPKTAEKVLQATDQIIAKNHLTAIMVTHNMKDAIAHGNRLVMLHDGRIILDIGAEEKKKLTVQDLLHSLKGPAAMSSPTTGRCCPSLSLALGRKEGSYGAWNADY